MNLNVNLNAKDRREKEIRAWLITRLSEWLIIEAEEIYVQEPFASYGLSSVAAINLTGDLGEWLGIELSPILAYEYPTVESLARHLADELGIVQDSGEVH